MLQVDLKFYNGPDLAAIKCLSKYFSVLGKWPQFTFLPGSEVEVMSGSIFLGTAIVEDVASVPFHQLSNMITMAANGIDVIKQAHLFNIKYGDGAPLDRNTTFTHAMLSWNIPNVEAQLDIVNAWSQGNILTHG